MAVHIAIPSTFTSNLKNRTIRAFVIGSLARWAVIFQVRRIFVYYDEDRLFDSHGLGRYTVKLLKYSITPPWLKKRVFPLKDTDRFFGAVPPLNIRTDPSGNYGWGFVEKVKNESVVVSTGEKKFRLNHREFREKGFKIRERELVPLNLREKAIADIDSCQYIGFYPQYIPRGLKFLLKKYDGYKVATSRFGEDFRKVRVQQKRNVLIVFGGPHRGLFDMGVSPNDFDVCVNLFPEQTTKTIRSSEAVPIALFWLRGCVR